MARVLSRYINLKMGSIGALVMGGIVFYINYDHGVVMSLIAGVKQGLYTLLLGGALIRGLERITLKVSHFWWAVIIASIIISIITIVLVFGVHNLKGTPKPFASTLPTIFMAPPGFFVLAWQFKKRAR